MTGDLEWFARELGFPYSGNFLCAYLLSCRSKKEGRVRLFTDCRKDKKIEEIQFDSR